MSNYAMATILEKGLSQAQALWTVCTSACGKPFPKIVPKIFMAVYGSIKMSLMVHADMFTLFPPDLQTFRCPRINKILIDSIVEPRNFHLWDCVFALSYCVSTNGRTHGLLCLTVPACWCKAAKVCCRTSSSILTIEPFFQVYKNRLIDRAVAQIQYTHSTGISLTHVLLLHPTNDAYSAWVWIMLNIYINLKSK